MIKEYVGSIGIRNLSDLLNREGCVLFDGQVLEGNTDNTKCLDSGTGNWLLVRRVGVDTKIFQRHSDRENGDPALDLLCWDAALGYNVHDRVNTLVITDQGEIIIEISTPTYLKYFLQDKRKFGDGRGIAQFKGMLFERFNIKEIEGRMKEAGNSIDLLKYALR